MTWTVRTEQVRGRLVLPGRRVRGRRTLVDDRGLVTWLVHPPSQRRWTPSGTLASDEPVGGWRLVDAPNGGGALVEVAGGQQVEIELVELGPAEARAAGDLDVGASPGAGLEQPMTVIGSWAPLGGPIAVGDFLVGARILDANDFAGRRCPSEQTALGLWRIALLRGGPFWEGFAAWVAAWAAARIQAAPGGLPVHDLEAEGETHTRFLADAALLCRGELERTGDARFDVAGRAALAALDGLAADLDGDPWYRHDTGEAGAGRNDLVLNTHVHTIVARLAWGLDVSGGLRALDTALGLPSQRGRAWVQAGAIATSDLLRATPWPAVRERGWRLAERAHFSAARSRTRAPHLALPGGWLARDAMGRPTPSYLTVNLHDLAVLGRNRPTPASARALLAGLRWFRRSGFARAQRLAGDPLAVLVPVLLRNAGEERAARRAASATAGAGVAPCPGWPGFVDRRWAHLAEGTP